MDFYSRFTLYIDGYFEFLSGKDFKDGDIREGIISRQGINVFVKLIFESNVWTYSYISSINYCIIRS